MREGGRSYIECKALLSLGVIIPGNEARDYTRPDLSEGVDYIIIGFIRLVLGFCLHRVKNFSLAIHVQIPGYTVSALDGFITVKTLRVRASYQTINRGCSTYTIIPDNITPEALDCSFCQLKDNPLVVRCWPCCLHFMLYNTGCASIPSIVPAGHSY
ncbi:hypothetical protein CBL_11230 [Carabus blaptoides fortunei]